MKAYEDVKRAAEAAQRGLIRSIIENLEEKEADKLCLELSMSLFAATLDFSLPVDKFFEEAQSKSIVYQVNLSNTLCVAKAAFDKGEINEADTF